MVTHDTLNPPFKPAGLNASGLTVKPLSGAKFGMEIIGLDPGNISDAHKATIWNAYRTGHGLVCFSFDRLLETQELFALTAVFGENEYAPGLINGIGKGAQKGAAHLSIEQQVDEIRARGDDPYLSFIGNVNPDRPDEVPTYPEFFGEWKWHTDMSYLEVPPTFSLLHARQIPASGGDTGFCNQVMAAQHLSDTLRNRVANLKIKHAATFNSDGSLRPGMSAPASPIEAVGHPHPIIRTVPSTGEEALFLGRRLNGYVMDRSLDDSEDILDELWAHATQAQYCYRHQWQVGQVVAWDNRMLMHMRYPMDESEARLMWRTQTRGEAVVS